MTGVQVYRALQKLAREQGRVTHEILTLYGLERVLARLQQTPYRDDFALKGGVLLAAYALRRPTRDADMQALDFPLDEAHLLAVLRAIAAVKADDGLIIDADAASVQSIREEDDYSGLRLKFTAHLNTARLSLALDVSTGDPIYPAVEPVILPGLLGNDVQMMGHPVATVVAEKSVTVLQRGTQSTRWRDYVDLRNLARTRTFNAAELAAAIAAVAQHRQVQREPIAGLVVGYGAVSQPKWAAWRKNSELTDRCLESLDDQLAAIVAFIDPVLDGTLAPDAEWDPTAYRWFSPAAPAVEPPGASV